MPSNLEKLILQDMKKAGKNALAKAVHEGLFMQDSAAIAKKHWPQFCVYVMECFDVSNLGQVTTQVVREYGKELSKQVYVGALTPSSAENLVAAVNIVMSCATNGAWKTINPTKDCQIGAPRFSRTIAPASVDLHKISLAVDDVRNQVSETAAAVVSLKRHLGLSCREAAFLDVVFALEHADTNHGISINKGGDDPYTYKTIEIATVEQMDALKNAASLQGQGPHLLPEGQIWAQWKKSVIRKTKEILLSHGFSFFDLRAAFACDVYERFSDCKAPVLGGVADSDDDLEARERVAYELGHSSLWATDAYLGARL